MTPPGRAVSAADTSPPVQVAWSGRFFRQLGADSVYLLAGFPIAIVTFVLLVVTFALGVGLLVTVAGLPILVGSLYLARGFADLERLRLRPVLFRSVRRPVYRPATGRSWLRRMVSTLGRAQYWLDLVHGVFGLILAVVTFSIAVAWWAVALGGTFTFAYDWAIPRGEDNQDLPELIGWSHGETGPRLLMYTGIGLFALVTLPFVLRGCTAVKASFSRALLTTDRVAALQDQVENLTESRDAVVSAEATALRRLERDIHDGPQQRLVRLAMDLGTAQRRLDRDPDSAKPLVADAITQARETLSELRALSRGIAPPVLADRGLAAALAAVASRCSVRVDLDVALPAGTRLPEAVENAAYFVVAEALTNVAKHSDASHCVVRVGRHDNLLVVVITDDGTGGAHPAKGSGLAGLSDRVRGIGGTLAVSSPAGGPTEIAAELPCG